MNYASEFKRRRGLAVRRSIPWIIGGIVVVLGIVLWSPKPKEPWQYYAPELALSFVVLSVVVRVGYIASEHIRCPKCDENIWLSSNRDGYVFNPAKCPKCGVALK